MNEINGLSVSINASRQLGTAIRAARLAVGWTQLRLAQALSISRPDVARWESGRVRPGLKRQWQILALFQEELKQQKSRKPKAAP